MIDQEHDEFPIYSEVEEEVARKVKDEELRRRSVSLRDLYTSTLGLLDAIGTTFDTSIFTPAFIEELRSAIPQIEEAVQQARKELETFRSITSE